MRREQYLDRSLPSSEDAERAVLGGILIDQNLINQCIGQIIPNDFYSPLHRRVFAAMMALYEKSASIDPILIAEELKHESSIESIGGISTITNLTYGLPYFTDITEYVDKVREKARARKLIQICNLSISSTLEEEDIDQIIEMHENLIYELRKKQSKANFQSLHTIADTTTQKIYDFAKEGGTALLGLTTGFRDLDNRTAGLESGDLIIIAARPSMGKTALSLRMAFRAATTEAKPVIAYFSLEMSDTQLAQRMIATEAGVDLMRLRRGMISREEWSKVNYAREQFTKARIFIDQTPGLSTMEIRSRARQLASEQGAIGAIYIDHLGLIGHGNDKKSRHLQISDHTKALKGLAKDLNVPVLALCQLSRKPEERKPPVPIMSDLRDSGSIEEDADVVFMLYRHNYYYPKDEDKENEADCITGKARNGPTGKDKLVFTKNWTRFDDYKW